MSPLSEGISSGSLGALNVLFEPRGLGLAPATTWCACSTR